LSNSSRKQSRLPVNLSHDQLVKWDELTARFWWDDRMLLNMWCTSKPAKTKVKWLNLWMSSCEWVELHAMLRKDCMSVLWPIHCYCYTSLFQKSHFFRQIWLHNEHLNCDGAQNAQRMLSICWIVASNRVTSWLCDELTEAINRVTSWPCDELTGSLTERLYLICAVFIKILLFHFM